MGTGEAGAAGKLRRAVGFHVAAQLLHDLALVGHWVRDGGHRLVDDAQLLPSSGALPVVKGGILRQTPGKLGPVVDHHRSHLHHPLAEVRQRRQQIRPLLGVPEDAGLVFMGPVVLGKRRGIPGAELT